MPALSWPGMTPELPPELSADIKRDYLALVAAFLDDDDQGSAAVAANTSPVAMTAASIGYVIRALLDGDLDPRQWVREQQALLNA